MIAPLTFLTTTVNSTLLSELAATSTSAPAINFSAVSLESSSTSKIPSSINFAKDSSLTFALPATSPVFFTVIVYVTLSPTFAGSPAFFPITSAVFVDVTIAVCVSFVSSPLTTATFAIVPSVAFTITLKLNVFSSFSFKSIVHATTSFPVVNFVTFPPLSTELSTYVVCDGILSFTSIPSNTFPELFLTVILYVSSSPFVVKFSPVFVSHTLFISKASFSALISANGKLALTLSGAHVTP